MPRNVDGTSSILKAARVICRMVGLFGVARLGANTSPAFAAAVSTFVLACQALEALDDQPYVRDRTAPFAAEDTPL